MLAPSICICICIYVSGLKINVRHEIYMYAFGRHFYTKRVQLHSRYTLFSVPWEWNHDLDVMLYCLSYITALSVLVCFVVQITLAKWTDPQKTDNSSQIFDFLNSLDKVLHDPGPWERYEVILGKTFQTTPLKHFTKEFTGDVDHQILTGRPPAD